MYEIQCEDTKKCSINEQEILNPVQQKRRIAMQFKTCSEDEMKYSI